jgi:hypothetical protein
VPGFAGFYIQEDGTPVIRLKDMNMRAEASDFVAREIEAVRGGRVDVASKAPVYLAAAYDFAELKEWTDKLDEGLDREDVYSLDLDEVENGIHVGVRDGAAMEAVREHAKKAGIPENVLTVVLEPAPEQRQTVQQWVNPIRGGHQIAFTSGLCTAGFNAWWNGQWIFVTNSHCTPSYFANDGGTIWQPTIAAGNQIGWEVRDRGYYWCAFLAFSCRRSDAAYIRHNGSRGVGQGRVARTPWNTGGPGGLNVVGTYDIVSRYTGSTPVGMELDKTGRTSGSTYGRVTRSCVKIGRLRCQDVSRVWSQPGDSGSPMMLWIGGSQARPTGTPPRWTRSC